MLISAASPDSEPCLFCSAAQFPLLRVYVGGAGRTELCARRTGRRQVEGKMSEGIHRHAVSPQALNPQAGQGNPTRGSR